MCKLCGLDMFVKWGLFMRVCACAIAAAGSNLEVGGCKYNMVVMIFLIKAAEEQLHEYTLGNQRREALYCD